MKTILYISTYIDRYTHLHEYISECDKQYQGEDKTHVSCEFQRAYKNGEHQDGPFVY
jgi:hypothetical protein